MSNWLLYLIVIFSWSTSWFAIKFQLGEVHPQMSVAYRFILAGVIILLFCFFKNKKLKFTPKQHGLIALQGFLMFSTNYIFIYKSSQYLASGLVSVIFSVLTFMNIFNSWLLLKQKSTKETLLASLTGFIGIMLVFGKEIFNVEVSTSVLWGVFFGVISTYSASLGNMASAQGQKKGLPIIESTGLGMFYGGVWTLVCALLMGHSLTFSWKFSYISSLLFLSIFASVFAFISYLTLMSRIGPGRAAYCALVFPVVAILISMIFENYHLSWINGLGFVLILIGNYIVMFKPNFLQNLKKQELKLKQDQFCK